MPKAMGHIFDLQIEKQALIVNINRMRARIGLEINTFNQLYSRSVVELRKEQDRLIKLYNEEVSK